MSGADGPTLVEGRTGIGGFARLYVDALARLRSTPPLRWSLARWTLAGLGFTVAGSETIAALAGRGPDVGVLVAALGWWLAISLVLFGGAPLLRKPDLALIDYYGIPNGLCALRAWSCLPLLLDAIFHLPGNAALAIWCIAGGAAGMLDYFDGLIARRVGPLTELGRAIDPAMDSLFFSMAAVGNVLIGIIPWWVMVLLLVRYLGPLLATPLVLLTGRRPELVRTEWGRRNTALVGAVLFTCMWVRIFNGPSTVVATLLAGFLLLPTTLLHFGSLVSRIRSAPRVRVGGGAGPL